MSNDVSFSLASILSDFGAARRADPKKGEAGAETGGEAQGASFRRMLPEENGARPAATKRPVSRRTERTAPGQIAREDQIRAQAKSLKDAERTIAQEKAKPAPEAEKPVENKARNETEPRKPVEAKRQDAPEADTRESAASETSEDKKSAGENSADSDTASSDTPATERPVVAKEEEGAADASLVPAIAAQPSDPEIVATQVIGAVIAEGGETPAAEGEEALLGVDGRSPKNAEAELAAALKDAAKGAEAGETPAEGEVDVPAVKGKSAEAPGQQLAAKAEEARAARPEEGKQGIGEEVSAFASKGKNGEAEGVNDSRKGQPSLHPKRAVPFGELLEGFTHQASVHRPADILAGLDRQVAASALNRQTHEIQRPTPIQMLPVEIGMQAVRGVTNFQIRLDPAELGRVDVNLQIRDNGEVHASLVVDRVETLAMLKRDASTLEYAFEQAGLRQSADGLSFSLRGENGDGRQQEGGGRHAGHDGTDELELQAQIGDAAKRRVLIPNSSVDLMV
ncbi:MAG: flagellar hook-length control protein FliK [Proteobacteria bacterium]|nr:flagellar hook-length control protein FliK [Pseudomonadota bacterium]